MKTKIAKTILLAVMAGAVSAGTLNEGLRVPQRSKTQLTLTQAQKKHLTVKELKKLKLEQQKRREAAAAWIYAQKYRKPVYFIVPARPSYSQCGFFMR